jgi:hypothetical protein
MRNLHGHLGLERECPPGPLRDMLLVPILKIAIQSPELVGIGPPVAHAALLVVPLKRVSTMPRGFAAVAEEGAKVPLVPLKSLVEVDARHVAGRGEGRQQGYDHSNPSSQKCARLFRFCNMTLGPSKCGDLSAAKTCERGQDFGDGRAKGKGAHSRRAHGTETNSLLRGKVLFGGSLDTHALNPGLCVLPVCHDMPLDWLISSGCTAREEVPPVRATSLPMLCLVSAMP